MCIVGHRQPFMWIEGHRKTFFVDCRTYNKLLCVLWAMGNVLYVLWAIGNLLCIVGNR